MKLCWEATEGAPGSYMRGPLTVTGHKTPGESSVNITDCNYDTTHLQENPQRLG